MARRERPWYWTQRRCWYVIVNGKRHRLDADKTAAFRRWHVIAATAAGGPPPTQPVRDGGESLTLRQLVDDYLADQQPRVGEHRRVSTRSLLGLLTRGWGGDRRVATLTANDFTRLSRERRWAPATATLAKRTFAAACNWAVAAGRLAANPLRGLRTGRGRVRDLVLPTAEQTATLLAAASRPLRDVIEALIDTGCRPSEVFTVTAADVRGDRWVLSRSKSGEPRTVYLTPRVKERCGELAAARPTGPLYLSPRGRPWPLYSPVPAQAFRRLRRRCGLPAGLTLYSFRHLWASDAIAKGVPEAIVAAQLGNTVAVLVRHYIHLRGRGDAVRDALRRVRGSE